MNDSTLRVDSTPFEQVPHWILFNENLSSNAVRIWLVLRKYRDWTTSQCYPGRKKLAELCQISVKTVDRELPNLEAVGAITVTKRRTANGDADTNLYHVHWEPYGDYPQGRVKLTLRGDRTPRRGGVTESHKHIPTMNTQGIPEWIDAMEDGPEHDAVFLAHQKGLI